MKKIDKKIASNKNSSKIKSKLSIEKKLDIVTEVNFVSDKMEKVNIVVNKLELTF
jgi:hypothetical protein